MNSSYVLIGIPLSARLGTGNEPPLSAALLNIYNIVIVLSSSYREIKKSSKDAVNRGIDK